MALGEADRAWLREGWVQPWDLTDPHIEPSPVSLSPVSLGGTQAHSSIQEEASAALEVESWGRLRLRGPVHPSPFPLPSWPLVPFSCLPSLPPPPLPRAGSHVGTQPACVSPSRPLVGGPRASAAPGGRTGCPCLQHRAPVSPPPAHNSLQGAPELQQGLCEGTAGQGTLASSEAPRVCGENMNHNWERGADPPLAG